jgi:hypothetical protein
MLEEGERFSPKEALRLRGGFSLSCLVAADAAVCGLPGAARILLAIVLLISNRASFPPASRLTLCE